MFFLQLLTIILFRVMYTVSGSNSAKIVLPFEKGSTLKGKNLLPRGANSFLLKLTPFQKTLMCRKANRKSQKLSPL